MNINQIAEIATQRVGQGYNFFSSFLLLIEPFDPLLESIRIESVQKFFEEKPEPKNEPFQLSDEEYARRLRQIGLFQ